MNTDSPSALIEAHAVVKRFGKRTVLGPLDFELAHGKVTALLGPNGAGKSTFLKLCLGVLRAEAGTLRVLGLDPQEDRRELRRQIGFVPDVPDAFPWMTVRELFRFLEPQYPSWDAKVAAGWVERLQIPDSRPFRTLSRGEGMKAMLAAALAPSPQLLLLDEPFAGLDPLVREEVLRGVIAVLGTSACTVLVATHDLDVVARIAERVAILTGGRIAVHGTTAEVVQPQTTYASAQDDRKPFEPSPTELLTTLSRAVETSR